MRILQAPYNIANVAWGTALGLRSLGQEAEVWQVEPNKYAFPCDRTFPFPPPDWRTFLKLIDEALDSFDAYHFHYGGSLVPRQRGSVPALWDLPLYRNAGKRVVFTFHGSDVRIGSVYAAGNRWWTLPADPARDDAIRKRLELCRTYADRLFVTSPIDRVWVPEAYLHPRVVLTSEIRYAGPTVRAHPRVVHAPSNRAVKGTEYLLAAVESLRSDGIDIDLTLLENLPHQQLLEEIAGADIVIDNLILGDYGVIGLEAMAMGKTVVCRLADEVRDEMGSVPVVPADPKRVARVLKEVVSDRALREELGPRARSYVEEHHSPRAAAEAVMSAYSLRLAEITPGFPDWAHLGDARHIEDVEREVVQLRAKVREAERRPVWKRGPVTTFLGKIEWRFLRFQRRLRHALDRARGRA